MQAVLLALSSQTREAFEWTDTPPALRPVLDRPFVHHVVERLVDQGITDMIVVTERDHGWVGPVLGDGRRWGCTVTHVAVAGEAAVVGAVRQVALASVDPFIVVAATDRLPRLTDEALGTRDLVVVNRVDAATPTWDGWAALPPACLAEAAWGWSLQSFGDALVVVGEARGACVAAESWLDVRSATALLASNHRALEQNQAGMLASGRQVEPGIWVGRNVRLGPRVRLVAPAFIGDNTHVGAGSTVGPCVAIGSACLIDADALLERSMVTAGTYVGEGLNVVDAIVDGPTLVNVRLGASVRVDDGLLLAGTPESQRAWGAASR